MSQPVERPEVAMAGFVLAGGQSSRMRADKALIQLGGQALVERALRILRKAGLTAVIAGARSPLSAYAPVIEDDGRGPLGGICAALASVSAEFAVFLPVDLPFLPVSLIRFLMNHALITGAVVTVPSVNGFAQSFPAVVERSVLPSFETTLRDGDGGCFSAFQAAAFDSGRPISVLAVESLVQCGQISHPDSFPAAHWFLNVNTPGDRERAQSLLETDNRVS